MKTTLFSLLMLLFFSCSKSNLDNIDSFSFGSSHGFCQGNCAHFFMVRDGDIYPDQMDYYYSGGPLNFKSEALPEDQYILAKKLIDDFPEYLLNNPGKTYGCPDCADQGSLHIEIRKGEQTLSWHFDTDISQLPEKIQDYVRQVSETVEQLK